MIYCGGISHRRNISLFHKLVDNLPMAACAGLSQTVVCGRAAAVSLRECQTRHLPSQKPPRNQANETYRPPWVLLNSAAWDTKSGMPG